MGQEEKQLVLRPSKVKWGIILAVSVVLAAVCVGVNVAVLARGRSVMNLAGFALVLNAIAMIILAYTASIRLRASRSFLRLESGGFSYKAPLRAARHRWADVGEFSVMKKLGARTVCFDIGLAFGDAAEGEKEDRAVLWLPDNYGMDPQALADLMNEWRQRAISAQGEASHEAVG